MFLFFRILVLKVSKRIVQMHFSCLQDELLLFNILLLLLIIIITIIIIHCGSAMCLHCDRVSFGVC